jgi:2-polyprenyl-3-methyl-5-hydroxy-6-metoxy-1,4-benzoquinol methylase
VRCSACTTLFSDITEEHYVAAQRNAWHDDDLDPGALAFYGRARELAQARFLATHPPAAAGRLLDVGCGLGFFVERALAAGWDAYGCDTSVAWTASARQRVGDERVRTGELGSAIAQDARFDLITSWDVLEHVFHPIPFLRAIAGRLAPGGRVFIRTPNEAWVYPTYAARRRLLGDDVELGPLNHVVYYRSATLARALAAGGLRAVQWPSLPPPQVSLGNRASLNGSRRTAVVAVKNAHAALARRLAAGSDGRLVLSSDLDAIAVAAGAG